MTSPLNVGPVLVVSKNRTRHLKTLSVRPVVTVDTQDSILVVLLTFTAWVFWRNLRSFRTRIGRYIPTYHRISLQVKAACPFDGLLHSERQKASGARFKPAIRLKS